MEVSKQKAILTKACFWLLAAAAIYICLKYLLVFLLPFLLGLLIAWLLRPVAGFLNRHSGLSRRAASIVSAILFYAALGALLWLAGWGLSLWVGRLRGELPLMIRETILPFLSDTGQRMGVWERRLGAGAEARQITDALEQALGSLTEEISKWCMLHLGNAVKAIPAFGLALIFTILSSVLICSDYEGVSAFVMRQIPQRWHGALLEVRDFLAGTLWRLVKAYLILMAVTFGILAAGLGLLGVQGFWLIAAVIAVLDLLPVIGSGIVLVPWAGGLLLGGQVFTGVGLLLLWVLLIIVREILEPRLVGRQIGLHPLATLTAMYMGFRLAGFTGLLVAPVACLLLQHLQQQGYIKIYRSE